MKFVNLKSEILNNVPVHFIQTQKFKTIYFVVRIKGELNKETISKRALLPFVLRKATKSYPSEVELQNKLDDLYGATLSLDGVKMADYHILSAYLEIANDKYIQNEESLVNDSLNLLHELIFEPKVVDGAFDETIFQREKRQLKNIIESIVDDKMRYANIRLIDEMFKGEKYSTRVHGYIEDLEKLTSKELFEYYQSILENDEMELYILGDFDEQSMRKTVENYFQRPQLIKKEVVRSTSSLNGREPKEIVETQDINQAKLHIGYRTNCTIHDEDYFALQVFNGLFGALPSSKLFINVREKHSLAYYAASRIDSLLGLLIVYSGIDGNDYEKAKTIINDQLISLQQGDFTEENLKETKKQIVNNILEALDNPDGIMGLLYQQQLAKVNYTTDELIDNLKNVTKEEIINVAKKIELDTVYLLTNKVGESDE